MKPIYMSNSISPTFVDDEDFPLLNRYTWRIDSKGYAVTNFCGTTLRIHRFILNPPKNIQVDHINGDKLKNTKDNLRLATNAQNQQNVPKIQKQTSSKYKGVHFRKDVGSWVARITVNGKRIHLGFFGDEISAAKAYNGAAIEYHGEFANINEF